MSQHLDTVLLRSLATDEAGDAVTIARRVGAPAGLVRATLTAMTRAGETRFDPETGWYHPLAQSPLVAFWNETLAPKFTRFRHVLEGGLSLHSEAIFPRLGLAPGEHVLDVGCGFGDTCQVIASAVAPGGRVLGVDCGRDFIAIAREEAASAGLANLSYAVLDAESAPFDASFDRVFSRFGTMFFGNPVAGLRNLRRALSPGATFTMIVWRTRTDNPWLEVAREVALRHLPPPGEGGQSCGPGPFSMADETTVRAQLHAAGFAGDPTFERIDAPIRIGNDIDDAIAFQLAIGPAGEICREAGGLFDEACRARLIADLARALEPHARADGVYLGSSSWLINARNPA